MEKVSAACAMDWSIKLEKALRSKNPARAAEVIMETGGKLEQWRREREPSTAVYNMFGLVPEEDRLFANTILLRLVDAFCSGDKLVRLAVVRVFMSMFRQSRRKKRSEWAIGFLSKTRVENHLELLKRVKGVYENGDIEGRAMALVLFGCWRDFASDYAPIRYLIFTSMVSSHDLEVRSSLFAAACFSEVADDFALVVLGMLVDMVKFPELAPMTRLAAVRVFAKMGCSHTIANRAFKMGLKIMLDTSEEDSVVAFLVSLTKLASRSTQLASELRETVMPLLLEDTTPPRIRAVSLRCLHFLVERGMCFSLVHASTIEMLSSLLNKAELSLDMLIQALQILHKILAYKLCTADAFEFSQLIIIVENASHSTIMSSSYSAISFLADLVNQIVQTAEKRSLGVPSTSLPLQVIELITDKLTVLRRSCSNPFQVDCAPVGEVQNLFNCLRVIGKHSEMGPLVLDKIILLLEYVRNSVDSSMKTDGAATPVLGIINYKGRRGTVVRSNLLACIHKFLVAFLEDLEVAGATSSQTYEKVKHIVEFVRSCSFLDGYTQIVYSLLLHSQVVWGCLVNEMKTKCDVDGNSDILLVADLCGYGIFTLECSKQMFMERDYWPAYRAGIHAARLGAWVTSAFIFSQLRTKVQSDVHSVWLHSLTYFAYAEGKIQLLSSPVGNSRLVSWLGSNSYLPELTIDTSGKSDHNVVLHEAYKHLVSSLEALESNAASSEVFCFQKWFLVLKTRLLGTVLDYFKHLDLVSQDISGKKQAESRTLVGCDVLKQFTQISIRLQTLAKEYDTLATCFIDIDHGSSSIIAEVALSCSVLALAAGFALFIPELPLHGTLAPCTSRSSLCSRLVQDLAGRLWKIDPETSKNLTLLIKVNEPLKNCFHLQPRNQASRVCGKVKGLLSICRGVLSDISSLRERADAGYDVEIMSEITRREHHHLLSEAVMKWIRIPFGSPKHFFCVRPFIGSELFTRSSDIKNPDRVSVGQGFHLPLDLCLQLKNRHSKLPVKITRLYCLLYTRLAFHIPGENGQDQSCCSPWKNKDLMEMSERLFRHATKSGGRKDPDGHDWNSGKGVVAIVKLEPNERGQGFSSCLLDVTRFPVGSYQIKWLSCCIDSSGCYWNLLPLNAGPVFTVLKAPVL